MELKKYNNSYKSQLNDWQADEGKMGENDFNKFVVLEGSLLGDYLEFIETEMQTITLLAFDNTILVGFVCYEEKEKGHYHVEIMGVSPTGRGKGYAQQILKILKSLLMQESGFIKLTLSVSVKNTAGKKAFDKVGNNKGLSDNKNYYEYEL